jgi:hypothetical protein
MKNLKLIVPTILLMLTASISKAQGSVQGQNLISDPEMNKIIPDKFFEFGIPLLIIFIIINAVVTIIKNKSENQLKLKMVEKGVSEDTLIQIFKDSNRLAKLQPLKWFLFTLALAISLIFIHFLKSALTNSSGYLAVGIILILFSIASLIFYRILSKTN